MIRSRDVRKLPVRTAFCCLLLAALPQSASAATSTGSFNVSMTIQSSCTLVSSSAIAFGTHGMLTANTDATGTLDMQCTANSPYTVALDAGVGAGATTATRKLTSGGATIDYALYRDAARTLSWGNTQGTDTVAGTGSGASQSFTVYGRVPSQATPAAASYSDTVNVTITY